MTRPGRFLTSAPFIAAALLLSMILPIQPAQAAPSNGWSGFANAHTIYAYDQDGQTIEFVENVNLTFGGDDEPILFDGDYSGVSHIDISPCPTHVTETTHPFEPIEYPFDVTSTFPSVGTAGTYDVDIAPVQVLSTHAVSAGCFSNTSETSFPLGSQGLNLPLQSAPEGWTSLAGEAELRATLSPGEITYVTFYEWKLTPLPDRDRDGVPDVEDNCPDVPNPNQDDFDGDGIGDVCDPDDDNDTLTDDYETNVSHTDPRNPDTDGGGVPDGTEVGRGTNPQDPSDDNGFTLTVTVNGQGTVAGSPGGICPPDCSQTYAEGTIVDLSATASSGWQFSGWSADCTGSTQCSVTMDQNRSVTATFVGDEDANIGVTCGRSRYDWYANGGGSTSVTKGEEACVFLLSNPVNRELLRVAFANDETLTEVFARYVIANAKDEALQAVMRTTLQQASARALIHMMPEFANVVRFTNLATVAGSLAAYQAVPLFALLVLDQIETKGACIQVIADVDGDTLHADWSLVFNPDHFDDAKATVAGVFEKKDKLLQLDEFKYRRLNLRCGADGLVYSDDPFQVEQIFSTPVTTSVIGTRV